MSKTRSIFEDVADKPAAAPAPRRAPAGRAGDRRGIAVWLAVLFALIVAMIVVGRDDPAHRLRALDHRVAAGDRGAAADDAAAWTAEFEKYQATPQYEALNRGMTLRRVQDDLLVGVGAPPARPGDRPGLGGRASSGSGSAAASRRAGRRGSSGSASSAGCRGRSAGGWSAPASPPGWTRSPPTGSPSISGSPSCCSG